MVSRLIPLPECRAWRRVDPIIVDVAEKSFSVGRSAACNVETPRDPRLSSVHFVLQRFEGDSIAIVDQSTNGTFVNGTRIEKGKPQLLADRDVITCVVQNSVAASRDPTLAKTFVGFRFRSLADDDSSSDGTSSILMRNHSSGPLSRVSYMETPNRPSYCVMEPSNDVCVAWLPDSEADGVVLGRSNFMHCSEKAMLVKIPHQHLKVTLHTKLPQCVWSVTAIGINPACVKTQTGLIKKIIPESSPVLLCVGDVLCGLWDPTSSSAHFPLHVREFRGDSPRPVTPADSSNAAALKLQRAPTVPVASRESDEHLLRSFTAEAEAAMSKYQDQLADASQTCDAVKATDDVLIDLGRFAIVIPIIRLYDPAFDYKTRTKLHRLPAARNQQFWDHPPKKLKKSECVPGRELFFVPQGSPNGYVTPYNDGMNGTLYELPTLVTMNRLLSYLESQIQAGAMQCEFTMGHAPPLPWIPVNHKLFPKDFRDVVFTVLTARVSERLRTGRRGMTGFGRLPYPLLFHVFSYLPHGLLEPTDAPAFPTFGGTISSVVEVAVKATPRMFARLKQTDTALEAADSKPGYRYFDAEVRELFERLRGGRVWSGDASVGVTSLMAYPVDIGPNAGPWARHFSSGHASKARASLTQFAMKHGTTAPSTSQDVPYAPPTTTSDDIVETDDGTKPSQDRFDLFHLLEAGRPPLESPQAPTPSRMKCELMGYQKRCLAWMMAVESGLLGASMGPQLHPAWRQWVFPGWEHLPFGVYQSRLNPTVVTTRRFVAPLPPQGGILADEMGLGKTLEVLSLILSRPRKPQDCATDFPEILHKLTVDEDVCEALNPTQGAGARTRSRAKASKDAAATVNAPLPAVDPADEDPEPVPIKASLIVCPQAISTQWLAEIEEHCRDVKVLLYPGMTAGLWAKDLAEYDVVIGTYETLRKDLRITSSKLQSPLLHCQWWRIILDEAQMVCSSTSAAAQMATAIPRKHSWCVSGTPISNRIKDLQGLLQFLGYEPYDLLPLWRNVVQQPYDQRSEEGLQIMHGLIRTVMWRHRKVHVEHEIVLPRCRVEEVRLDLSPLERSYYDKRHDEVKRMIKNLKGGNVSAGVLVALTTLRQICCHPQIVRRDDGLLGPSGQRLTMEQIVGKLVDQARAGMFGAMRELVRSLVKVAGHELCPNSDELLHRAFEVIAKGRTEDEDGDARNWITVELAAYQALQVVHRRASGEKAVMSSKRRQVEGGGAVTAENPANFIAKAPAAVVDAVTAAALPADAAVTLDGDDISLRISALATFLGIDDESREILPEREKHDRRAKSKAEAAIVGDDVDDGDGGGGRRAPKKRKAPEVDEATLALNQFVSAESALARAELAVAAAKREVSYLLERRKEALALSRSATSCEATGDGTCTICLEVMESPSITPCGHMFCKDCIYAHLYELQVAGKPPFCPLCRVGIEDLSQVINAASRGEDLEAEHVKGEFGTKVTWMMQKLIEIRAKAPQTKSIVFSQWARLLSLVGDALKLNGFTYSYLTGKNREAELDAFRNDPESTVLLVSMRSGGGAAGLTLTMATYGFILEPSLNVGIEDQAVGRLHRIGQRRDVTVYRLLTNNTIEGKIIEMQAQKRRAAARGSQAALSRDEKEKVQTEELYDMFGIEE